ncbi:hypothetical protein EGH21_01120 [Halomicroarcula sp. F13]|uniref:Uncharacterized protein n=1 Tax=Haloarcula rubra TaxID=2487747 RepID=A0AAW4PM41_9EURY|nr:hypothetical protein [Halomicroarcula rubra]MBX0321620.1 hypothetical protein [Halomicroarcula rubra]
MSVAVTYLGMDLPDIARPSADTLDQLAGVTGLGWTTSLLGFLTTLVGYGHSVLSRFAAEPQTLLYLGVAFFVATLGLDRLAASMRERRPRSE